VQLNDSLLEQFLALCSEQVRQRGEILLDIDSTDDPTHGQQQLSFFNGATASTCITPCWSSNATPDVCWRRAYVRETPPAMPHRAHAAAPGAAFAIRFPRREDQAARRRWFCSATSL